MLSFLFFFIYSSSRAFIAGANHRTSTLEEVYLSTPVSSSRSFPQFILQRIRAQKNTTFLRWQKIVSLQTAPTSKYRKILLCVLELFGLTIYSRFIQT